VGLGRGVCVSPTCALQGPSRDLKARPARRAFGISGVLLLGCGLLAVNELLDELTAGRQALALPKVVYDID